MPLPSIDVVENTPLQSISTKAQCHQQKCNVSLRSWYLHMQQSFVYCQATLTHPLPNPKQPSSFHIQMSKHTLCFLNQITEDGSIPHTFDNIWIFCKWPYGNGDDTNDHNCWFQYPSMKTNCHKLHPTIFLSIQVCISTNLDELVLMSVLPLCSHVGGSWHRV